MKTYSAGGLEAVIVGEPEIMGVYWEGASYAPDGSLIDVPIEVAAEGKLVSPCISLNGVPCTLVWQTWQGRYDPERIKQNDPAAIYWKATESH